MRLLAAAARTVHNSFRTRTWLPMAAVLGCVAAVTALTTGLAEAGSVEDGVYKSNLGYEIRPPEDWTIVDRGNRGVMTDKMPAALQKAPPTGYDVMFFDGEIEDAAEDAPEIIHDNIIVVVVPAAPTEVSTEQAAGLASAVEPELKKLFPGSVTLQSAITAKHAGRDSLDLEWSVEGAEGALKGFIFQSVLVGEAQSIMVTCTFGEASAESFKDTCTGVIDSIKVD